MHKVCALVAHGHEVTAFDNLGTGHCAAMGPTRLVVWNLLGPRAVEAAFASRHFDVVMHLRARSLVGETVSEPDEHYRNSAVETLDLLRAMRAADVGKLVFSSSAAVFGKPEASSIEENHPNAPINPYGASKLMVERMLANTAQAHGLCSLALRYFNAADADPSGETGASHQRRPL
ncbi:MAG: NAD-dependent epimerase/dehydratase family protein [Rhodanobacter sp.]